MKAFAYLTVAVLAVIGIGVGLVGGLPSTNHSLRGVPTTTYSVGGVHFSIVFGGSFSPFGSPSVQDFCMADVAGTADHDHLAVSVAVWKQAGLCVGATSILSGRGPTPCYAQPLGNESPAIRPGEGNSYCAAAIVVQVPKYYIMAMAENSEGSTAAQDVVKSFKFLGTG